jgi:translation initiation factor IF-3
VAEVRCVGPTGDQLGVITTREALIMAQNAGLDLVEIAPNAQPPVCKITDYGKYRYDLEKKEKESRKHQTATRVKEVQFHPNVGDHDFETKVRHIRDFLNEGHRVKVALFFRGRESAHQDLGFAVINKVIRECQDLASAEQSPKLMGRAIFMLLSPKPNIRARQKVQGQEQEPASGEKISS